MAFLTPFTKPFSSQLKKFAIQFEKFCHSNLKRWSVLKINTIKIKIIAIHFKNIATHFKMFVNQIKIVANQNKIIPIQNKKVRTI